MDAWNGSCPIHLYHYLQSCTYCRVLRLPSRRAGKYLTLDRKKPANWGQVKQALRWKPGTWKPRPVVRLYNCYSCVFSVGVFALALIIFSLFKRTCVWTGPHLSVMEKSSTVTGKETSPADLKLKPKLHRWDALQNANAALLRPVLVGFPCTAALPAVFQIFNGEAEFVVFPMEVDGESEHLLFHCLEWWSAMCY